MITLSLLRTLIPCRPVLVEFLPWRGALRNVMCKKLGSHVFDLLQTDTGGDNFTATGDGDKDTCKVETGL